MKKISTLAFLVSALVLAAPAFGGSGADPDGTPFGLTTDSDAKGQKLNGVMTIEFTMLDIRFASQARVLVRLRSGSQLGSVFVTVPGPLDTDDPDSVQAAVFAVIEAPLLAKYFPVECGPLGDQCPGLELVLKDVEEVTTTDDGAAALFLVGDVVVAATQPAK